MNNDLMKAILALDAYNRGYNQGLIIEGVSIGNASILQKEVNGESLNFDSAFLQDENGNRKDIPASFYAIAYEYGEQVIVSYRGTDQILPDAKAFLIGGGFYQATQAELAIKFFKAVDTDPEKSLSLTGHSLGGGLAGFVSSLLQSPDAGKTPNAVIFDNMPF